MMHKNTLDIHPCTRTSWGSVIWTPTKTYRKNTKPQEVVSMSRDILMILNPFRSRGCHSDDWEHLGLFVGRSQRLLQDHGNGARLVNDGNMSGTLQKSSSKNLDSSQLKRKIAREGWSRGISHAWVDLVAHSPGSFCKRIKGGLPSTYQMTSWKSPKKCNPQKSSTNGAKKTTINNYHMGSSG